MKPHTTFSARRRLAAALCAAGLMTGALGGGLLGAGAEDAPTAVPGETVATPSELLAESPSPVGPDEEGTAPKAPEDPQGEPQSAPDPTPQPAAPAAAPAGPTPPAPAAPAAAPPAPAAAPPAPAAPATPAGPLALPQSSAGATFQAKGAPIACVDDEQRTNTKAKSKVEASVQAREEACPEDGRKPLKAETDRERQEKPATVPDRDRPKAPALRNDEGVPTMTNPSTSLAIPGPAPVGVPNFFIDKFRIPPFLLPIYQAAGTEYGIRWEVLAAINEIETDYGRNLNISSAGALGWMQFMPATWRAYGVDANRDGKKDPFNPVDAIFAAARYLKAAGGDEDLGRAIFAYNRADWYVQSVLMRARLVGGLPTDLVGSLTGLTQGRFPVAARARYADDISERDAKRRVAVGTNAAMPVESAAGRRGINIFTAAGSPVVAVQDGRVEAVGRSERLGRFVRLRDAYGNTYTYAHLKKTAPRVAVPKEREQSKASIAAELELPKRDPKPTGAASAGRQTAAAKAAKAPRRTPQVAPAQIPARPVVKERLYAHPGRERILDVGGAEQILAATSALPGSAELSAYFRGVPGLKREDVELRRLLPGRRVIAGTILGRVGQVDRGPASAHILFEIRPSGRGAPRIDPKPILDGWKLLESTAIYRARGRNPLLGGARSASIGQILLMSKETLQQRVLANPRIEIYSCGQSDIRAGIIDRRVLATLEFLASSGLRPTVTSLNCGHGFYTASGNVSAHSSGNAVDIAKINGVPILGNQGEGSITDMTIRRLLSLQGTLKPNQIISLMKYDGVDNTLALGDHADHIHVGFAPEFDPSSAAGRQARALLRPTQWIKLIDRIGQIDNPTVAAKPSRYAVPVVSRASSSHRGE